MDRVTAEPGDGVAAHQAARPAAGGPQHHHGRARPAQAHHRSVCVRARASLAALTLKTMGYEDVAILDGGLKAWTEAGLPTNKHEYSGI